MGSKERIARRKEEVHQAILSSALDILCSEGIDAISMRKIADQIEYTAPIIYCYYKNKEELFLALLAYGYQKLNRAINESIAKVGTALERLGYLMNSYIDFAVENRELYILMFQVGIASPKAASDVPEAKTFIRIIQRIVTDYREEFPSDRAFDANQSYFTLISLAHGMITINYYSKQYTSEDLKTNLKRMYLRLF